MAARNEADTLTINDDVIWPIHNVDCIWSISDDGISFVYDDGILSINADVTLNIHDDDVLCIQ